MASHRYTCGRDLQGNTQRQMFYCAHHKHTVSRRYAWDCNQRAGSWRQMFVTHITNAWFLTSMRAAVFSEFTIGVKSFTTHITTIWLLSSMHVAVIKRGDSQRQVFEYTTHIAIIRLLTGVRAAMLHEASTTGICFTAHF